MDRKALLVVLGIVPSRFDIRGGFEEQETVTVVCTAVNTVNGV